MKVIYKPLVASLLAIGVVTVPAYAVTNQSLEATVQKLQNEVTALKRKVNAQNGNGISTTVVQPVSGPHNKRVINTHPAAAPAADSDVHFQEYLPFDPDVPGQAYVSSGPYIGVNIQFAGTDLIINSPSVNTDLQLLTIRKNIINQLNATLGESGIQPTHSHLLLSGVIESQANYTNHGGAPSTTDIDVTNVSLDTTILGPSEWILGFVEFSYNNGSPASDVFDSTSNYRTANSRVFVNKAFVTLGNLTCSPFYGTFGQYFVPFGTYSTVMVSETLTKIVGRTKARAIELGMMMQTKNALYASAYIFRGDSHAASVAKVNNGGVNVGVKFDWGLLKGNVGGGIIGNIADSGGMQFGNNFQDFEQINHRVPAYDLRAALSIGQHLDLLAEFISATKQFNMVDMSYNNHGATPSALDLEAAYSFTAFDRPSSVGIGYGKSNQVLALGIPLTRESIVFNTSWWRNTLQSLELRHDRQYAESDVATSAGDTPVTPEQGKSDNAITAQFDYYF